MFELLDELGVVPTDGQRRVVQVRSIDYSWYEIEHVWARAQWEAIVNAAARVGAAPPVFLAGRWGTEENRLQRESPAFGRGESYFPSTLEELEAAGFDWLADPHGFSIQWDENRLVEAALAEQYSIFGVTQYSPMNLMVCVDGSAVVGWARGFVEREPTDMGLGLFVEECHAGLTSVFDDFSLPVKVLEANGLAGRPFALVLPRFTYGYVTDAVALAGRTLGVARTEIPVVVVSTDTVAGDGRFVDLEEHALLLQQQGVEVDLTLSESLPEWLAGFTHSGVAVLLFDDQGELLERFGSVPFASARAETLSSAMLRLGLF